MTRVAFGLELPDDIGADWDEVAHLLAGELRDDGSIDYYLILESGSQRYIATAFAKGDPGVVEAPPELDRLANMSRQVIETNVSILRDPTKIHEGFWLSVHPVLGRTPRVAVILEPQRPTRSGED